MKMMASKSSFLLYALFLFFLAACSKGEGDKDMKDMEKPVIETGADAAPQNCQVYVKGEAIHFKYTFTDNKELGNYNIEIHNNFDHHTHSTDAGDCPLDEKKSPVEPWVYNQDFTIPPKSTRYEAHEDILIPGNIDPGDYHFMIRVTDKSGWQQLKAVSIKILEHK